MSKVISWFPKEHAQDGRGVKGAGSRVFRVPFLLGGAHPGRGCGASEHISFEQRDAIEAPRSINELLDKLGFGRSSGLLFVEEAAAMIFVFGAIFGREDRRRGGQAVAQGVRGGMLLAGLYGGPVECSELARLMAERL